jgi:hypothetical protein
MATVLFQTFIYPLGFRMQSCNSFELYSILF